MPIYDVMLETAPSDLKLLRALCDCFEDAGDDASLLSSSIERPTDGPGSLITVDRWPLTGDFALYASIATPFKRDGVEVARFLADRFATRALVRGEAGDDRAFTLVDPTGDARAVTLMEVDDAREIRLADPV